MRRKGERGHLPGKSVPSRVKKAVPITYDEEQSGVYREPVNVDQVMAENFRAEDYVEKFPHGYDPFEGDVTALQHKVVFRPNKNQLDAIKNRKRTDYVKERSGVNGQGPVQHEKRFAPKNATYVEYRTNAISGVEVQAVEAKPVLEKKASKAAPIQSGVKMDHIEDVELGHMKTVKQNKQTQKVDSVITDARSIGYEPVFTGKDDPTNAQYRRTNSIQEEVQARIQLAQQVVERDGIGKTSRVRGRQRDMVAEEAHVNNYGDEFEVNAEWENGDYGEAQSKPRRQKDQSHYDVQTHEQYDTDPTYDQNRHQSQTRNKKQLDQSRVGVETSEYYDATAPVMDDHKNVKVRARRQKSNHTIDQQSTSNQYVDEIVVEPEVDYNGTVRTKTRRQKANHDIDYESGANQYGDEIAVEPAIDHGNTKRKVRRQKGHYEDEQQSQYNEYADDIAVEPAIDHGNTKTKTHRQKGRYEDEQQSQYNQYADDIAVEPEIDHVNTKTKTHRQKGRYEDEQQSQYNEHGDGIAVEPDHDLVSTNKTKVRRQKSKIEDGEDVIVDYQDAYQPTASSKTDRNKTRTKTHRQGDSSKSDQRSVQNAYEDGDGLGDRVQARDETPIRTKASRQKAKYHDQQHAEPEYGDGVSDLKSGNDKSNKEGKTKRRVKFAAEQANPEFDDQAREDVVSQVTTTQRRKAQAKSTKNSANAEVTVNVNTEEKWVAEPKSKRKQQGKDSKVASDTIANQSIPNVDARNDTKQQISQKRDKQAVANAKSDTHQTAANLDLDVANRDVIKTPSGKATKKQPTPKELSAKPSSELDVRTETSANVEQSRKHNAKPESEVTNAIPSPAEVTPKAEEPKVSNRRQYSAKQEDETSNPVLSARRTDTKDANNVSNRRQVSAKPENQTSTPEVTLDVATRIVEAKQKDDGRVDEADLNQPSGITNPNDIDAGMDPVSLEAAQAKKHVAREKALDSNVDAVLHEDGSAKTGLETNTRARNLIIDPKIFARPNVTLLKRKVVKT